MTKNIRFLSVLFVFTFVAFIVSSYVELPKAFAEKGKSEVRNEEQAPGPGGPGAQGKPGPGKPPEYMKNLTPEQREEAQRIMMLSKSRVELANAYADDNKIDEAVAEIKKVLTQEVPSFMPKEELDERKAQLTMRIIEIYMKGGREELAMTEAESLKSSGNLKQVQLGHLYTMLGNYYKKKGDKAKALEMLKKSVEILEKAPEQKK